MIARLPRRTAWVLGATLFALTAWALISVVPGPLPLLAQGAVVADGEALYGEFCASCHGANLEGQPDWQSPKPDGTYPAPPHSAEGHTWHHEDAMLLDYVKRGGAATLADMGVEFASAMPAFGDVLTEEEIEAILAFIASTWPEEIRQAHEARQ